MQQQAEDAKKQDEEDEEERERQAKLEAEEAARKAEEARRRPPSPALCALYTSADTFLLSMGAYDAGYLYECSFEAEEPLFVRFFNCILHTCVFYDCAFGTPNHSWRTHFI
jgi:hypothetical protein